MLKYLTFAVKVQLNVHDLNNEAVAGNVTDIRIMEFLNEQGKKMEAPAVSGRMLKHWHYDAMRELINQGSYPNIPLCDGCKVGEPIKPGKFENEKLTQVAKKDDKAIIESCISCDVHGYLIAAGAKEEEERGISARRISRAMFSWLMPSLESEFASKQVIHNRVSADPSFMMPFSKSYASGIYGFVSALDIDRIGLVERELTSKSPYAIDDTKRKERARVVVEAYRYMISGKMGASLSHAIPHADPIEILVVYSETGPLPFPISPIYSDYVIKTKGLMPSGASFLFWNKEGKEQAEIKPKDNIGAIFNELLSKL